MHAEKADGANPPWLGDDGTADDVLVFNSELQAELRRAPEVPLPRTQTPKVVPVLEALNPENLTMTSDEAAAPAPVFACCEWPCSPC